MTFTEGAFSMNKRLACSYRNELEETYVVHYLINLKKYHAAVGPLRIT